MCDDCDISPDLDALIADMRALPPTPSISIEDYKRVWPFAAALFLTCAVALTMKEGNGHG